MSRGEVVTLFWDTFTALLQGWVVWGEQHITHGVWWIEYLATRM